MKMLLVGRCLIGIGGNFAEFPSLAKVGNGVMEKIHNTVYAM